MEPDFYPFSLNFRTLRTLRTLDFSLNRTLFERFCSKNLGAKPRFSDAFFLQSAYHALFKSDKIKSNKAFDFCWIYYQNPFYKAM